jgi:hypothetical protein
VKYSGGVTLTFVVSLGSIIVISTGMSLSLSNFTLYCLGLLLILLNDEGVGDIALLLPKELPD